MHTRRKIVDLGRHRRVLRWTVYVEKEGSRVVRRAAGGEDHRMHNVRPRLVVSHDNADRTRTDRKASGVKVVYMIKLYAATTVNDVELVRGTVTTS